MADPVVIEQRSGFSGTDTSVQIVQIGTGQLGVAYFVVYSQLGWTPTIATVVLDDEDGARRVTNFAIPPGSTGGMTIQIVPGSLVRRIHSVQLSNSTGIGGNFGFVIYASRRVQPVNLEDVAEAIAAWDAVAGDDTARNRTGAG